MSFLSCVVRLILKKTSLLLSVTLMLRCSEGAGSSGFGDCEPADIGAVWDKLDVFRSGRNVHVGHGLNTYKKSEASESDGSLVEY